MAESVIIIGGGASGLMAGITAARRGVRVTILEQNEKPGRKIIASGNGRCNFTNRRLEERYYHGSDRSFIRHVIDRFNAEDAIAFFREIGLIPMEERDGWMYPLSGQSSAVLDLLLMEAERLKVKIKTNEHVTSVEKSEQGFTVITESWHYEADACVVASGSPASSVHGSTGDAAKIAERFGIAVKPYRPALVPLKIEGNSTALWAGTRVAASVSVLADGKKIAEDRGEVQLTEYGISGIPVFQVCGACVSAIDEGKTAEAVLNFLPEIGKEELRSLLEARKETLHLRKKEDLLIGMLPDRLIPVLFREAQKSGRDLADVIGNFHVRIKGAASLKQAQVCSGGILTSELKESMECRSVKGLYFIGEAVDADGCCGGYNLQWAWASGHAAGTAVSDTIVR